MDQSRSYCPKILPCEITDQGTGWCRTAGEEDPVELDFSLKLCVELGDVAYKGDPSTMKHLGSRLQRAHFFNFGFVP